MSWSESKAWMKGTNNQKLYQALLDDAVRGAARALDAEAVAYYECLADEREVVQRSCTGRTFDASIVQIGGARIFTPCAFSSAIDGRQVSGVAGSRPRFS